MTGNEIITTTTAAEAIIIDDADLVAEVRQPSIFDAWISQLDVSEKTRRAYRAGIRRYSGWLTANGLAALDVSSSDVRSWRDGLTEEGLKPGTVNAYLSAVKRFYSWCSGYRLCPDVARDVKRVKSDPTGSKDALTVAQARQVLDSKPETVEELRNAAIISLTLYCGLRTVEVARADVADLRQQGGRCVLWVQGKGHASKDRFVNVEPEPELAVRRYLAARGQVEGTDPLFASCSDRNRGDRLTTRTISGIIKARLRACGMDSDRLTAHSLRHTAVTFALLGGAPVAEVQQMARHANINTTMIYSHAIDRAEAVPERAVADYIRTGKRRHAA